MNIRDLERWLRAQGASRQGAVRASSLAWRWRWAGGYVLRRVALHLAGLQGRYSIREHLGLVKVARAAPDAACAPLAGRVDLGQPQRRASGEVLESPRRAR